MVASDIFSQPGSDANSSQRITSPMISQAAAFAESDFLTSHLGELLVRQPASGNVETTPTKQKHPRASLSLTPASHSKDAASDDMAAQKPTTPLPKASAHSHSFVFSGRRDSRARVVKLQPASSPTYKTHNAVALPSSCDEILGSFFTDKANTPYRAAISGPDQSAAIKDTPKKDVEPRIPLDHRSTSFVYAPTRRPRKLGSASSPSSYSGRQSSASDAARQSHGGDESDRASSVCQADEHQRTPSELSPAHVSASSDLSTNPFDFWRGSSEGQRSDMLSITTPTTSSECDKSSQLEEFKGTDSRNGSIGSDGSAIQTPSEVSAEMAKPDARTLQMSLALRTFQEGGVIEPPDAERELGSEPATAMAPIAEEAKAMERSSRFTSMTSARSSVPAFTSKATINAAEVGIKGKAGAGECRPAIDDRPAQDDDAMSVSSIYTIPRSEGFGRSLQGRRERLVPKDGADGRTFVFVSQTPYEEDEDALHRPAGSSDRPGNLSFNNLAAHVRGLRLEQQSR